MATHFVPGFSWKSGLGCRMFWKRHPQYIFRFFFLSSPPSFLPHITTNILSPSLCLLPHCWPQVFTVLPSPRLCYYCSTSSLHQTAVMLSSVAKKQKGRKKRNSAPRRQFGVKLKEDAITKGAQELRLWVAQHAARDEAHDRQLPEVLRSEENLLPGISRITRRCKSAPLLKAQDPETRHRNDGYPRSLDAT
jgi:hypothetical protein